MRKLKKRLQYWNWKVMLPLYINLEHLAFRMLLVILTLALPILVMGILILVTLLIVILA